MSLSLTTMPSSPFPPRPPPTRLDFPRGILRMSPPLTTDSDTTPWAPRVRPNTHQHRSDLGNPSPHPSSHIVTRPRPDIPRSSFASRVHPPGYRGRSASDVRIVHTPPPDLEPDRLARACGQSTPYRHDARLDPSASRLKDIRNTDLPPLPKVRVGHMYRRLDTLARRSSHRAMDYLTFEDLAIVHKRDSHLRDQLRRKPCDRFQEKDPNFHAIGAPLEDVLLYASTPIVIGEYQHHLPIVVVACVEELTKTGIYQSGLFRALPSRDRHLQLIDLFDKSPDFGSQFNMRGQAMPDICALLSTFISSLPTPLLDPNIYSALWHWSVKPSVKRDDARRDRQEEGDEDRRARGELPNRGPWITHTDLYLDDADIALETDQLSIAQILLRFLPSPNLSLLVYLCAFFTQLPLCPENGLQLEDVARIFGHRLLGGSVKLVSQRMMMWLLTRWHRISDTLFGDTCGMTPPPSPPHKHTEDERVEKRKGKRESGPEDTLQHATSSSSTDSPEDHVSSRRSSEDVEDEGESSEGSRRRKKRGLDVLTHEQVCRSSTRKEARHGPGSRRHHQHGLDQKNPLPSPDPFAVAFAKAQQELVDAPLLTAPIDEGRHVVDVLLKETAAATSVAKALAERVEVLERALQVRGGLGEEGRGGGSEDKAADDHERGKKDIEDGLRLQLRRVEVERDEAQRIVRDMRAYLLDDNRA